MSMDLRLSKTEPSRLLFYNEAMVEDPMFRSVAEKLRRFNIIARNMVCYMSEPLCIFALNYGREVSSYDAAVLNSIVMQTLFLRSIASQIKETDNAFEYTVNALARASEVNDEDTGNHILRVGIYSALIATQLKMPQDIINALRIQASLHDVGKIHVSAAILKKSGKLTSDEWLEMRKHPLFGQKIIGEHSRLKIGSSIARTHHERYDGSGYPKGLRGDDIPIEGRIVAIADQYDALRLARVYKPAFTHDDTCRIILNGDGRTMPEHFDPQVLKAFHDVSTKFEEGYEAFKG
jgi:HD-GYP domain-containing protein (c-di-GMP phosphodiesterase class II)